MIVVIEGMDAAGKQTQSKLLAEKINGTRFSFPNYESSTGKLILAHLKKEWECRRPHCSIACMETECCYIDGKPVHPPLPDHLDAMVFQSLQIVNRVELFPKIAAAQRSGHVVFDRYWQSGYVYGALDGLDRDWLLLTQERPMPPADINILIDVPVQVGFDRRPERRDRYEKNREFLEKVRVEYLKLWGLDYSDLSSYRFIKNNSGWYVIDGIGTVDEVHERIMMIVDRYRGD